jgi:ring-1,2-phenylacetyl-CoA epoxidase subunit PaaE
MTSSVRKARKASAAAPGSDQAPAIPPSSRKHAAFHLLKVAKLDRITDDAVAITFEVPEQLREEFSFLPGQHLAVRATIAGDDIRRNYSICAPASSGALRIGVKKLPGGVFSSYAIERLQVGDSLEVLSPTGSFSTPLDPAQTRHYGAVAAGLGITPILSILASALEAEPGSQATLIFVNRNASSIMFLEDVEDLKNKYLGRLQVFHVLDEERQETEILSGKLDQKRLTGILDNFVPYPGVGEWFLCGPIGLTDMVRDTLMSRGADDRSIHRELFHADATPPRRPLAAADDGTAKGFTVTVILDGRGTSFQLPGNTEPILDATLRLRGDAPYACKNGVCGTCRSRLVSGTVEMSQNFALEPDEIKAGYVLACQAYPTSDDVVLDFDQ